MAKEFNFKKSKFVGSRFENSEAKVSVTTRIDSDVVAWLRGQADKTGIRYQTLINSILKQAMSHQTEDERIRRIVKEELRKQKP